MRNLVAGARRVLDENHAVRSMKTARPNEKCSARVVNGARQQMGVPFSGVES
jgi:hypothetical protein